MPWTHVAGALYTVDLQQLTTLLDTHVYGLTMLASTNSNPPDSERVDLRVSGLKPVPEPTTLLLLGAGIGMAGIRRWRRRSHASSRG